MTQKSGIMKESSGTLEALFPTHETGRRIDGAPVYTYSRAAGIPPVSVLSFPGGDWPVGNLPGDHAHAHDFLVLAYFERGGGSVRLGRKLWSVRSGDVFIIAPGEVIGVGDGAGLAAATGWVVFFPVAAIAPDASDALLSWRSHPLLFPFLAGAATGGHQLSVPPRERARWTREIAAMQQELLDRCEGFEEAISAHLTLLLISVSRLAADIGGELRLRDEPLLAAMFEVIDQRFAAGISLADVAAAIGLTPGHLTTVVRHKTGRTVLEWIIERRMTQARNLLGKTDLTVELVAKQAGFRDTSYFIKHFKRKHGLTPKAWRHAHRQRT